jgi:phosphatidylserine/phosphatidylglycerophosphate/cardiolipin synthase-like enzyme
VKTGIPPDPTYGNREWGIIIHDTKTAQYYLTAFLQDWNPKISDSYSLDQMAFDIPPDFYPDETSYQGTYIPCFSPHTVHGTFTVTPVFSPDTSEHAILKLIENATDTILIQQLYIYRNCTDTISPFLRSLREKAQEGVQVRIILNYNPYYEPTNEKQLETKTYLEAFGIQVRFHYTNWSYFTNIHNKGMIVDNTSVLISSINWNENSVRNNREAGVIVDNTTIATFYAQVFYHDWYLTPPEFETSISLTEYKNPLLILLIYIVTFGIIIQDWRKRQW